MAITESEESQDRGVARNERLHSVTFDHPLREAMDARSFWRRTVLTDPDAGILILGPRGRIHSINETAGEILFGKPTGALLGLMLFDALPVALAAERTAFYQHALRTERPLLANSVWRGVRCRERWELLPGDARLAGQVLWTVRRTPIPWGGRVENGLDLVNARENDWGALATLSERERSILVLLAEGCSHGQIARRLGIEGRELLRLKRSLRTKLGARGTADLIRHALLAGFVDPDVQAHAPGEGAHG
jgi:DNA-binding CsgD family transcriptional regulator